MKTFVMSPLTTSAEISAFVSAAEFEKYTHVQVKPTAPALGQVRVIPLAEVAQLAPDLITLTCGVKVKGLPFEDRPLTPDELIVATATSAVKQAKTPKAPKPAKAPKSAKPAKKAKAVKTPKAPKATKAPKAKSPGARGSGFIAMIDAMLLDVKGTAEGFPRSRHTVDEALARVLKQFPDKDPASVKKIIKVRPRHLEKRKDGKFDDAKPAQRSPRWAVVGPGATSCLPEVDKLHAKGATIKEIAAQLAVLHGRELTDMVATVTRRVNILIKHAKAAKK